MVLLTCSPNTFGVLEYRETPTPQAPGGTCRPRRAIAKLLSLGAGRGRGLQPSSGAGWGDGTNSIILQGSPTSSLKHLSPLTSYLKPCQGHLGPTVGTCCGGALAQIQTESFTVTASSNAGKQSSGCGPRLPGLAVQWGRSATKQTDSSISSRYNVSNCSHQVGDM